MGKNKKTERGWYRLTDGTEILFPEGMTRVEHEMFWHKGDVVMACLPEGLLEIGESAFSGCRILTEVHLPRSLRSIGCWAFAGCECLKEMALPEGLQVIGNHAFWMCTSLKEAVLPAGLQKIGYYAFHNCTSLTEVNIPESLQEFGYFAFTGCTSLTEVVLPKVLQVIGSYAFDGCTFLTKIRLPDGKTIQTHCIDGYCMEVLRQKEFQGIQILKCRQFTRGWECYVAKYGELSAHGNTMKEAVRDLRYKMQKREGVEAAIQKIRDTGMVTAMDYRVITGACQLGTQQFLDEKGLTWEDSLPLADALEMTKGWWGAEAFTKAFETNA